ncbi:MAG: RluA family pseudouridine synthase [Verrucomicrobia bacterium]|nr:RluA family pseudouridine synthase [Verrucomicrobiota bacterium]
MKLIVPASSNGETLLSFLRSNLKEYPSVKAIKRAIDAKQCKVNKRVETFSTHPLQAKDEIEIHLAVEKIELHLQVLYEDETVIAYNKPPGKTSESFTEYFMVHRLDKETSGVILFAKTEGARDQLIELFANRQMQKHYLALCDGRVSQEKWKVDNFLEKKASYEGGSLYGATKKGGKRAISLFQRLKTSPTASLLQVEIQTGRTHQIRVHLKEKGHPILGDWQYGRHFQCQYQPKRQMLHAWKISFTHPVTQKRILIEAPHFSDFLETEKKLGI